MTNRTTRGITVIFLCTLLLLSCTVQGPRGDWAELDRHWGRDAAQPGAGPIAYQSDYRRVSNGSWVQDKNFYVLTLLEHDRTLRAEFASDQALVRILKERTQHSPEARVGGDLKAGSQAAARSMMFSDDDIAGVRLMFVRRLPQSPALQSLVRHHLRPSGTYQRLSERSDAEMLGEAWVEAARGINHVIGQFALGSSIPYPKIDGPSYDLNAPGYERMILEARATAAATPHALFFEPSLNFALRLMAINRRDEPARHEPLRTGENRAAMDAMRRTDWSVHPYASVLVYGAGPDLPGAAISAQSRENCAAAAALYKQKLAPFIIVSGGYVHPKQTAFSEAVEMKRELMFVYGIPEAAVLIDPYARHTTTNVRNAARILFAARVPADKPSLSVSSKEHIDSIASQDFVQRCEKELGYMPAKFGQRISDVAVEFTPSIDSLQIDPSDPLDP